MTKVARVYVFYRKNDQDIRRSELMVDHGSVTNECAKPQIPLDQRRQRLKRGPGIDLFLRQHIHRLVHMRMRFAPPLTWCQGVMMQKG